MDNSMTVNQGATQTTVKATIREIVYQALVEVNPFRMIGKSLSFYKTYSFKFAHELGGAVRKDKNLSFEILVEILIRSFPVRNITEDLITNKDILSVIEIISPQIINPDGKIFESLLLQNQ